MHTYILFSPDEKKPEHEEKEPGTKEKEPPQKDQEEPPQKRPRMMGRHKVSLIYSIEIGSELTCTCYLLCSIQLTKNFTKDELQTIQRGAQLTDIHIQAAQVLIRREFPNIDGLQDPVLGDGNHYIPNVNEGMQIHHREIEVFCTCDMPECLDNMIMCDGCEEWFHLSCVGLKAPPPDTDPWHCRACIV